MSTQVSARQTPPLDSTLREALRLAGVSMERTVVAASLAVGVLFGYGGNFLPQTPQMLAHALSSIGLVIGFPLLALMLLRQRHDAVAAGLLVASAAEIVMWSNDDVGFAVGLMFFVPALLLISIPRVFPIWSRVAGALAAVPFGAHAFQFLLGNAPTPGGIYAIAGYTLLSIAIIGWIVAVVQATPRRDEQV